MSLSQIIVRFKGVLKSAFFPKLEIYGWFIGQFRVRAYISGIDL